MSTVKCLHCGKDVTPEAVLECAEKTGATLIGLSALMTTTVPAMEATIKLVKEKIPSAKFMVGGAVLTPEYAQMIGADNYSKDAMEAVRYAKQIFN
jgi:5-methyltetrahydrofolate--homocysteine methyltransferase